jgi:hypothetical protein
MKAKASVHLLSVSLCPSIVMVILGPAVVGMEVGWELGYDDIFKRNCVCDDYSGPRGCTQNCKDRTKIVQN